MADKGGGKESLKSTASSSRSSSHSSSTRYVVKPLSKDHRKRKPEESNSDSSTKRQNIVDEGSSEASESSTSLFSRLRLTPGRRAQLATGEGSSSSKSSVATVGANTSKNPREFWAGFKQSGSSANNSHPQKLSSAQPPIPTPPMEQPGSSKSHKNSDSATETRKKPAPPLPGSSRQSRYSLRSSDNSTTTSTPPKSSSEDSTPPPLATAAALTVAAATAAATTVKVEVEKLIRKPPPSNADDMDEDDSEESEESAENDMGRLQALLEARGLPPQLFGSLPQRMQALLHRGIHHNNNVTKAHSLLEGLESKSETLQLQSLIELSELLVMGNEETLGGFPVKQTIPALVTLLGMDHNFDMMNNAVRALTYMMEALPRSIPIVAQLASHVLISKLLVIQCMDVAEQCLKALEMVSKRHFKILVQKRFLASALTYLDFFSIEAQRNALQIAANCCQNLRDEEFSMVRDAIPFLTARLVQNNSDKKSIDIVCLAFSRIVESFGGDEGKLDEIAGAGNPQFFPNLQQLLLISPKILSGGTFILVVRMLAQLCGRSPQIAIKFTEHNIIGTIENLLFSESVEEPPTFFVPGRDGEILELVQLLGELTPGLPSDGIFALSNGNGGIQWQFKGDAEGWIPFSPFDSKIIETARERGEDEISLNSEDGTLTIDLVSMQQISEVSSVPIRRHFSSSVCTSSKVPSKDPRSNMSTGAIASLTQLLPQIVCLVGKSSAVNLLVKQSLLDTLIRLTHFLPKESVREAFSSVKLQHEIAARLANMLNNGSEKKIRVGAFQLIWVLFIEKDCGFHSVFAREGVFAGIQKLCEVCPEPKIPPPEKKGKSSNNTNMKKASKRKNVSSVNSESSPRKTSNGSSFFNRFTRQQQQQQQQQGGGSSANNSSGAPVPCSSSSSSNKKGKDLKSKATAGTACGDSPTVTAPVPGPSKALLVHQMQNRLKEHAEEFLKTINPPESSKSEWEEKLKSAVRLLNDSSTVREGLESLKWILIEDSKSDLVTSFELCNSGVIKSLLRILSEGDNLESRQRQFLHIFASLPSDENKGVDLYSRVFVPDDRLGLKLLVSKLSRVLTYLEQFEVKMHDVPRHSGSLRFFNTQQIKCNLERAPDCSAVGEWTGGTVKIDSLALVTTIERYLVAKVVNRATLYDSDQDDDDGTDNGPFLGSLGSALGIPSLELLCGSMVLPPNQTIYEALKSVTAEDTDVFSLTHTIQYRLKKTNQCFDSASKYSPGAKCCPSSVDPSTQVIQLLTKLFDMNRKFIDLYTPQLSSEDFLIPKSLFVNPRLSAKVARQLGDLITVMTGNLPKWIAEVASESGFLFGFELRVLLFYCFAFDKERAVARVQSALFGDSEDSNLSHNHHTTYYSHHRMMPRLDRRKKRFNRDALLKEAISCFLNELPSPRTVLEIEYENEVGTGSGPTAEFYSLVSQQLLKDLKSRTNSSDEDSTGYFPPPFPKGIKGGALKDLKNRYKVLGRLIWRALLDQRLLDIHLSPAFWKSLIHGGDSLTLRDLQGPVGQSLKNLVISYHKNEELDDLGLFFVLPGHSAIPLKKGGKHIPVVRSNLLEFVKLSVSHLLKNSPAMDLIRGNVETQWLKLFLDSEECQLLLCGLNQTDDEKWDVGSLSQWCHCDHGYTLESEPIRFLFQILSSFDGKGRRRFLHFITGSPRLPKNGLKDLKLTIVRKDGKNEGEEGLPSVMTCVNYLKLPPYKSEGLMRKRLLMALEAFDSPFTLS